MPQHKNPVDLVVDDIVGSITQARESAERLAHNLVLSEGNADRQQSLLYAQQWHVLDAVLKRVDRARGSALMRVGREGWLSSSGLYIPQGAKLTTDEQLTSFGFLPVFTVDRRTAL